MPGPFIGPTLISETFHPMKGPIVTQSLRGMDNHGPMHWRGDRTGGNDEPTAQPDGGTFNERAALMKFGRSFVDLLGRDAEIPTEDLASFRDFALQMTYPPNPIRALDNSPLTIPWISEPTPRSLESRLRGVPDRRSISLGVSSVDSPA